MLMIVFQVGCVNSVVKIEDSRRQNLMAMLKSEQERSPKYRLFVWEASQFCIKAIASLHWKLAGNLGEDTGGSCFNLTEYYINAQAFPMTTIHSISTDNHSPSARDPLTVMGLRMCRRFACRHGGLPVSDGTSSNRPAEESSAAALHRAGWFGPGQVRWRLRLFSPCSGLHAWQ